jgi:putative glycosyltransferase (TIGR04348 family)
MNICMACPAPAKSRKGNRVTADRWAHLLRDLGHRVVIEQEYQGGSCDLLIALHARKSYPSARRFFYLYPGAPLIVALTGTDLYRDIHNNKRAQYTLEIAKRLVVLQSCGVKELPLRLRPKARVIYQSAQPLRKPPAKDPNFFEVCVLGHLRAEKDPLRTALALRLLPQEKRILVFHAGEALTAKLAKQASAAWARDPRYLWVGELPRGQAHRLLARSHLLVLSSLMEGGANVIAEAVANGVPVLASRISGNVGMLGERYPGYFPVGDTEALARLLQRAEGDPKFYAQLVGKCAALAPRFEPARERAAWEGLLEECQVEMINSGQRAR